MRIITLTDFRRGYKININADFIVSFFKEDDEPSTLVNMVDYEERYLVKETPEEILSRLMVERL